jgi:cyclase
LKDKGLVKSTRFKDFRYIGDPLNAIRIFNDKKADELIFLDILASEQGRCIDPDLVRTLGDECNMPFTVGGGITTLKQIKQLVNAGAEKVCINSAALSNEQLVLDATSTFGSSAIVVAMDIRKKRFGGYRVFSQRGKKASSFDPVSYAQHIESLGAGELLVNSIEHDGVMDGYDIDQLRAISDSVRIPVIACGGAGSFDDMKHAITAGGASAACAGSLFVYHGPRKAVLINLPDRRELRETFKRLAS